MKNNLPKRLALKTLIKHKCYTLNAYTDIQRIIEAEQFTLIPYKKHANSLSVAELIEKLGIEKDIEQNDAFLYIKSALKFVFINADVSDEDKCSLLRHELGHICDPDLKNDATNYSKIKKEEFANEFSFYLTHPGIGFRLKLFILKKWKLFVGILAALACVVGFALMAHSLSGKQTKSVASDIPAPTNASRTYYVTSGGKKYHREHCMIIKYRNNLSEIQLDDAVQDGYKPCLICNPDKE